MIVGIVGKANVGKSTFFKSLTLADIEIANYPFATIDPNNGMGFVRVERVDKELGREATPREGFVKDEWRFVPVKVIDVAGLVPGAHEGKGLGSQFLSDLNQADVLIHVIDASGGTNEKGEPVPKGTYNPSNDIKFLEEELDYWYLGILKNGWDKFMRRIKAEHMDPAEAIEHQMSGVGADEDMAKKAIKGKDEDMSKWTGQDLLEVARSLRKQTKPMVIAANKADVPGAKDNIKKMQEEFPDHTIVAVSAESELALKEADKDELLDYTPGANDFKILKKDGLSEKQSKGLEFIRNFTKKNNGTGVQECLDKAVFDVLEYKAVYPGGVNNLEDSEGRVLPDCFLLPKEATALDFAYAVHSDFGENFAKAINVKTKKPISKDHVLKHRDVIELKKS